MRIVARVECRGQTGVEMEALTAAAVGLLTIYDMVKAVDRGMTLTDMRLEEKHGGKSGAFRRAHDKIRAMNLDESLLAALGLLLLKPLSALARVERAGLRREDRRPTR